MSTDDDRVRSLLEHAVADVEPGPGLDAIRSRTASPRRGRGWAAAGGVVAAAAAVAAVVTLSPGLVSPVEPTDPNLAAGSGPKIEVWYVNAEAELRGSGPYRPLLHPELQSPAAPGQVLDQAVEQSLRGRAVDVDYATLWPLGVELERAQLEGGVLSVDLSGPAVERPEQLSPTEASLALQQLVRTAQSASGTTTPVTFLYEGQPTATLLGQPTDQPVPAEAADTTVAAVSVLSPTDGSDLSSPFTVSGRAATFEANVQWELVRDTDNTVVRRGFATARECCTSSPYTFQVKAPPGDYTLVVHDEDVSDGEGIGRSEDTKQVTVR